MEHRRDITPPNGLLVFDPRGIPCPLGSASTTASYFPHDQDWSPDSTSTAISTPPRSPPRAAKDCGPLLLPRVRVQDQVSNQTPTGHLHHGHSRTTSVPIADQYHHQYQHHFYHYPPQHYGEQLQKPHSRARTQRRSRSPTRETDDPLPVRSVSPRYHMINDAASLARRSTVNHARSISTSAVKAHSRSTSSSSIDASTLSRYGYPTYRQSPLPQPAVAHTHSTRVNSAISHLAPIPLATAHQKQYTHRSRSNSPRVESVVRPPPPPPTAPINKVEYVPHVENVRMSTALEYLTAPNPTPCPTRRTVDPIRGQSTHFWFDVRNVRVWSDFHVSTITGIRDLLKLLQVPVPVWDLPIPHRVNLNPESATQLAEICANHHAVKVNAALKLTQGHEKHIAMRALRPTAATRQQQPEFLSSYQSDTERTIFGDNRGRVVGIVKCYEQWNSGMRSGEAPDKVKYLHGLAQLHRFMREHGTRYGFIMTEIELVCVRAGGPPSPTSSVPLFGYLEVAMPVDVSSSGPDHNANIKMTVGLALWWLHMLAKETPMPGQFHWRMEVGGPGARTRQFHLPRDEWMPKAIGMDTREAKRVRGWVWPNEPLSKRECGKGKRSKA